MLDLGCKKFLHCFRGQLLDVEAVNDAMGMRETAFDDQVHVGSHVESNFPDLFPKAFGNFLQHLDKLF
jgi:hypothetical protein